MKKYTQKKIPVVAKVVSAMSLSALLMNAGLQRAQAASQAWTNAPVDNQWTNVANWVGLGVPGVTNPAPGGLSADVATFTNAIPISGIGSSSNPITNDFARNIGGFVFDQAQCGAYVFGHDLNDNFIGLTQGGSIQVSAAVTNGITFNQGVQLKLPSSTNGRYSITNNAGPTNAVLFFGAITNTSASTRPMTITLAGSNTGTNTIGHIDDQANGSGAIQIFKEGPGLWVLPTANDIAQKTSAGVAATIAVENGTLEVQDPASLGNVTVGNLYITNAVLQIDNITPNNTGFTLRNGGKILMNGSGAINGVTMSTAPANNATLATVSPANLFMIGNGTANLFTGGAADSVLHTAGPGTVLFTNATANYIGSISVDAGTNQILVKGAEGTGPNFNIAAGATFDVTPLGASTTYTLDTKALSASGTGTVVGSTAANVSSDPTSTIDFNAGPINLTFAPLGTSGDTGHPALYCSSGTLSFHGNAITVNNVGAALGVGTYQLVVQASGNIATSGGFVALMSGNGLQPGNIAEIQAVGGQLDLVVTAYTPKSLVWIGNDPLLPGQWDRQISTNWLDASTPSTFNIYDSVAFDSTGSAAPTVTLTGLMQPTSVTVDTSANTYTFTGAGQIAGATSLIKLNTAGELVVGTANTYTGGTIISNGVVQLAVNEGISSAGPTGHNDVTIWNPAVFDLNNFSNTFNGLTGTGTIDITGGGTSTLNVGFNSDSGVFNGVIQNTSGTLGIVKDGTGTEALTSSNSYVGPTIVNGGTLRVSNTFALGGGFSPVTINNSTLDMDSSLVVTNLNGASGAVINSSTGTNTLTVLSSGEFGGVISGKIGLFIKGGTMRLDGVNTYSNGTVIAAGAGLSIGQGAAEPGPGLVIASNNVTIGMPTAVSASAAFTPPITNVDGATVTYTSGETANTWNNAFFGSALTTNIFSGGNMSIGGALSFSNYLGTVIVTNGTVRWFNASSGGDNTVFDFINGGGCFARNAVDIVHLGALFGNGQITAPSVDFPATYWIGAKGIDSEYSGTFVGSNNLVKVGAGKLTLDGFTASVSATDSATYTNYQYGSALTNLGFTTISNGVLALAAPNDLTASPTITLANPAAVLDATSMGFVSNFTDGLGNPNSAIVTNGFLTVVAATEQSSAPQVLGGVGTIKGNGVTNNGTISPGYSSQGQGGTLTINNALAVNASATNAFGLSDDPTGLVTPSGVLNVGGTVTLTGSSIVSVSALNGFINPGKYTLIKYGSLVNESGPVPTGTIPNFTLGGTLPTSSRATLILSNGTGEVDLVVPSLNSSNLVWSGGYDPVAGTTNIWDVGISTLWTNVPAQLGLQFFQQDSVTFDTTSINTNLLISNSVAPTTITVNGANDYTFGGPGNIIGDTAMSLNGPGYLLITNGGANTFRGGIAINGGILKSGSESGGNQNDLALGSSNVTVNAGGELRFGGNTGGVVNHFTSNNIVVNGGTVTAWDGAQHLTNSTVTINATGGTFHTVFSTKNLVLDSPLTGVGNLTIASATSSNAAQVVLNNTNNTISGAVAIATNGNLALTGYAGLSNAPTIDVQQGGVLDFTAKSNQTWAVVSGQTLKGSGAIRGKFPTISPGATIAPGISGAIGTLTFTNTLAPGTNYTVLTLSGTTSMDINRGSTPNADLIVNAKGTNNFGGTLNVNNLGAALQLGDTFTLFNSFTNLGTFATVNLPALSSGLAWNNTLAVNGKITVVSGGTTAPTVSPAITNFSLSGVNIVLNGTNGQTGATYYLMTSTNVALPLAQWKTVGTNLGAGNIFSFTGTNVVNSSLGRQFYILSSTNYNP